MGLHPDIPDITTLFSADDLESLRIAKYKLESPSPGMKLAALAGAPIEKLIARLPAFANNTVTGATQAALRKCMQIALKTLDETAGEPGQSGRRNALLHKLAVATTGAAGGAFGLLALPVELPVTTTLMFRAICEIARGEGENLGEPDVQLQCLTVFGLGGLSKTDDDADFGYLIVRAALAQAVSKASSEIASKGLTAHSSAALLRLVQTVAARFSVQVSEQAAAKSVPAIGAILGATINTVFIDHFQQVAHGHFTVRRLERRYGEEEVQAAYRAISIAAG